MMWLESGLFAGQNRIHTYLESLFMPPRFASVLLGMAFAGSLCAATPLPFGGLPATYSYVEMTNMALAARTVLTAEIQRAQALKPGTAGDVPDGKIRYYVEATVTGLVSGAGPAPATVHYLVDLPASLKKPKLKGVPVILLVSPTERSDEVRLIGPHAQMPRTPENEKQLRTILTAAVAPDAPPAVTGIGRAFHVAGSLPGEGETQIFLRTQNHRPISLSILRRPGEDPRWAVALSELVDASAKPPERDSFLWFRLACGLPRTLPAESLDGQAPEDAEQARADYKLVLDSLGPCTKGE